MIFTETQRWVIVGVTSTGFGCGRRGFAGVYTRVTHFVNWIKSFGTAGEILDELESLVTTTTTTTSTTVTTTTSQTSSIRSSTYLTYFIITSILILSLKISV